MIKTTTRLALFNWGEMKPLGMIFYKSSPAALLSAKAKNPICYKSVFRCLIFHQFPSLKSKCRE